MDSHLLYRFVPDVIHRFAWRNNAIKRVEPGRSRKITAPTNLRQGSSRANILIADGDEDYWALYSDPPIRCNKQETLKATVSRIIDSPLNFIRGLPEGLWRTAGRQVRR